MKTCVEERSGGRRGGEGEGSLDGKSGGKAAKHTRHMATRIDWGFAGVSSLLHEDQMTAYYSPLTPSPSPSPSPPTPPVTSVKNTGTRREIARVRHESSFISCYRRGRRCVRVGGRAACTYGSRAGARVATRAPQRRRAGGRRTFISPESVYMTAI